MNGSVYRKRTIDSGFQAGDPRHGVSPEQRLLSAVLDRALADLKDGGPNGRAAFAWLASDESGRAFGGWTFVVLCAHLSLSPEYLRKHLPVVDLDKATRRRRVVTTTDRREREATA